MCFLFFEVILVLQSCINWLILFLVLKRIFFIVELVMFFLVSVIGC